MCHLKGIITIEPCSPTINSNNVYLGAVGTNTADKSTWSVTVSPNNVDVKINTTADVKLLYLN